MTITRVEAATAARARGRDALEMTDADDAKNDEGRAEDEAGVTRKSSAAYAAGLTIFFSVATFLGLGWLLDNYFETSPWLLITGILLGSAVGFYEFIKIMSRNN